jgi:hypothetical protein
MFAIVGDVHGHHHRMVSMVESISNKKNVSIQFVLQVGDFEAHRDENDLSSMDAPQKYRKLGDFRDYYSGQCQFPWPLYFIGGNHEPYGWYEEHINGFELTPACHYLGRVNCQEIYGIKVVGISGIYREPKFISQRPNMSQCGYVSNKEYTYYNEKDIESAMNFGRCDVLYCMIGQKVLYLKVIMNFFEEKEGMSIQKN